MLEHVSHRNLCIVPELLAKELLFPRKIEDLGDQRCTSGNTSLEEK